MRLFHFIFGWVRRCKSHRKLCTLRPLILAQGSPVKAFCPRMFPSEEHIHLHSNLNLYTPIMWHYEQESKIALDAVSQHAGHLAF